MALADLEASGQTQIQLPASRTFDVERTHIPDRAQGRLRKCIGIQIICQRVAIAIRITQDLIGPLASGLSVKNAVETSCNREILAGPPPIDARQLPTRTQHAQLGVGKPWRWGYGRQIEYLALIGAIAVSDVEVSIIRVEISRTTPACVVGGRIDADAVRPRVIRTNVHAASRPALNREQHAMVVLSAGIFSRKQVSVELTFRWILQYQSPSLSRISRRRASSINLDGVTLRCANSVNRISREKDRTIYSASDPCVECLVPEIARRDEEA
jgi:hypothetical protein